MKEGSPANVFIICATIVLITMIVGSFAYNAHKITKMTENGYHRQLVGSYIDWVKVDQL